VLLFPDRVVALRADASPEAVLARLAGGVGEPPGTILFGGAPAEPFVGELRDRTFSVTRPLRQSERWGGRLGPRPVLAGDIQPDGTGTVVHLTARAEPGFRAREVAWLVTISILAYMNVANAIRFPRHDLVPSVVITAGLVLIPPLIRFMFRLATARSITRLADVIGGRVTKGGANPLTQR
jgi:hypothetical protein